MNNSKKHAICQLAICPLRVSASDESEIVSQLMFGDFVTVLTDGKPWIKIKNHSDGYEGWVDFKQLKFIDKSTFNNSINEAPVVVGNAQLNLNGPFGKLTIFLGSVLPFFTNNSCQIGHDIYTILPPNVLVNASAKNLHELCNAYLNAPYLWGGKSLYGIDCSGLTQNVFKAIGIQVSRDASQQVNEGLSVKWDERQDYDVVFFTTHSEKVTHVGILVKKNEIIHAHGRVRIDKCDEQGIFNSEQEKYTHQFHSIKRWI